MNAKINPFVLEIKRKYNILRDVNGNPRVKLSWVPARVGIAGNKLADSAAKQAATSGAIDVPKTRFTDLSAHFKINAISSTRDSITDPNSTTGRRFLDCTYCTHSKPWFDGIKTKRQTIVTINRIRSNHCSHNSSLTRKNLVEHAVCECGAEQEDIDHVLWVCPRRELHRPLLITQLRHLGFFPRSMSKHWSKHLTLNPVSLS